MGKGKGKRMTLKSAWIWATGSLVSMFVFVKSLVLYTIRIRGQRASVLFDMVKADGKFFKIKEEFCDDALPKEFKAIGFLKGIMFHIDITERMLQAGFAGTDSIINITLARWKVKKLKNMILTKKIINTEIPIYIMQSWDAEKIGVVKQPKVFFPSVYGGIYDQIDQYIRNVISGNMDKTGTILYGPPGNGKSLLVKHFSCKYNLPIYLLSLMRDVDNHSLIRMFARAKGPGIVLIEDFDTTYEGRKCLIDEAKFTFDTLLNVIDGAYSNNEKLIYFMTANYIDKVDFALKHRPSRFRVVAEVHNPSQDDCAKILEKYKNNVYKTSIIEGGYTMDIVMFAKEMLDYGHSFEDVCNKFIPQFQENTNGIRVDAAEQLKKQNEKPPEPAVPVTTAP